MSVIEYIGMRYIPKVAEPIEWNSANQYEYFTIVQYLGDTYLSTKNVPANTQITNTEYWIRFANFNGQYESIRHLLDIEKNTINYGTHGTNVITRNFNSLVNVEVNISHSDLGNVIATLPENIRPQNKLYQYSISAFNTEYEGKYLAELNTNGNITVKNVDATIYDENLISFSFTYFKD